MREAIGSSFLFKIMIIFIFFFTAFLAIAINYSQAFRAKNQIINALEQSEGYNDTSKPLIAKVSSEGGYFRNVNCSDGYINATNGGPPLKGICLKKIDAGTTGNSAYYSVETYIHFDFPVIGNLFTIPVRGETKLIVNNEYSP